MATGRVKKLVEDRGFGFIETDEGPDLFFHLSKLVGVQFSALQVGMDVAFDVVQGHKGPQASRVRLISGGERGSTEPVQQPAEAEDSNAEYRFLNPYNFVRLLHAPTGATATENDKLLFGKCSPPPHDRYVGLSGRIVCRLTTQSPLFATDAHNVIEIIEDHRSYEFFKYGGTYAIPSSSLRGMIRSVYEAATNSCLIHSADELLEFRESRPPFRKLSYKNSIHDVLAQHHSHLVPCAKMNEICVACRLFGWVADAYNDDDDVSREIGFKSRVAFCHGELASNSASVHPDNPFMLAILSSPSPKTVLFYLHLIGGSRWTRNNVGDGYDLPNVVLSGRKIYRRPSEGDLEQRNRGRRKRSGDWLFEFEKIDGEPANEYQNRTVRDVLDAGNEFTFTVDYQNLAELELGALLWSIQLEPGWAHRLGYAKPLGFGDVEIKVESLEEFDMDARYRSFANASRRLCVPPEHVPPSHEDDATSELACRVENLIEKFKSAMATVYGAESFDQLDNVRDLRALLGPQDSDRKPMHYPRSTAEPDPDGKNFKWFMANKKGRLLPLPHASDDDEGFPLME